MRYTEPDGRQNKKAFLFAAMQTFAAANDTEYNGIIPTCATKIAERAGASEQTQELVGAYASLADAIVDGVATKGVSIVGSGGKAVNATVKIIDKLNDGCSEISNAKIYSDAGKETFESLQQLRENARKERVVE